MLVENNDRQMILCQYACVCVRMRLHACTCLYVFFVPCGQLPAMMLSVALWFCYFQLENGCDSDCMVDCVIEWSSHIHIHICVCRYRLSQYTQTQFCSSKPTHQGVSGNAAGFPQFTEAPEGVREQADETAPWAVDSRTLLGFSIGLKHQLLIWFTLRSAIRVCVRVFVWVWVWLCGNKRTVEKWGKTWRSAGEYQ